MKTSLELAQDIKAKCVLKDQYGNLFLDHTTAATLIEQVFAERTRGLVEALRLIAEPMEIGTIENTEDGSNVEIDDNILWARANDVVERLKLARDALSAYENEVS